MVFPFCPSVRPQALECVQLQTISRISSKKKNVEKFTYTKTGATSDDEIDALSGATITTNAMTNGVNAGLAAFRYEKGGSQK